MKKVLFFFIIILCVFIINNLIHVIFTTWQKQHFLVTAQNDLQKEQQKHQQIEQEFKKVSQKQFTEEQARDKLLLVKPGEQIVIIPTQMLPKVPDTTQETKLSKQHWQEWLDYFFGQ
jgi:cell division protein FtsB